jgi:radical SAM enzyme (TIGR01210 family)
VTAAAADVRIRSLRPQRRVVDPYQAHGSVLEAERRPHGRIEQAFTLFASGAECPFTCSFCDLWQWSIDGPTPSGALSRQVERALESLGSSQPDRFKFYNASNFFDKRAVPPDDAVRIAELTCAFAGVTVESHASTIGPAVLAFAERIGGRLEVAMGLETIHPVAMGHLNKRLDLTRFDAAARMLSDHDIDLRVFVLLGAPYVPSSESIDWTRRTVAYAVERGAALVSIIPVRGGNGEMERLQSLGHFAPPTLRDLEQALEANADMSPAVITADLWDAERLAGCDACRDARVERMRQLNLTGVLAPRVVCVVCAGS